eukprot:4014493-Pleurochrysis_carterae.AAC.2
MQCAHVGSAQYIACNAKARARANAYDHAQQLKQAALNGIMVSVAPLNEGASARRTSFEG